MTASVLQGHVYIRIASHCYHASAVFHLNVEGRRASLIQALKQLIDWVYRHVIVSVNSISDISRWAEALTVYWPRCRFNRERIKAGKTGNETDYVR